MALLEWNTIITMTIGRAMTSPCYVNRQQSMERLGWFWEYQKCNILVATQALLHCLICSYVLHKSPLSVMYTDQAKYLCLCYNYYMISYTFIIVFNSTVNMERFAEPNICAGSLMKVFAGILLWYLGQQCL